MSDQTGPGKPAPKQETAKQPGSPDGELVFSCAGQAFGGWTNVTVNRGIEQMPSSFDIRGSVKSPGEIRELVPLNSPCTISIGGHVVLTGYLERASIRLTDGQHVVTFVGRGRCCDLVDTAAIISSNSRMSTAISTLAKELAAPYAGPILVLTPDGEGDAKLYDYAVNLGESPYDIIERIARWEGLLVYENADGNLVLSRVGKLKHASGFTEGQNIQIADYTHTMDQRFSRYIPLLMSSDTLSREGEIFGSNRAGKEALDPDITRYRPRIIISEQMVGNENLAGQRAVWEATRRAGQSRRITITTDSWLDAAGTPWTPNMLAPVDLPSGGLQVPGYIVANVAYRRDPIMGTTAVVTLMPPEAFSIQPSALLPVQARQITERPNPTGTSTPPIPPITTPNASPPRVNLYPPPAGGPL